ncbi:alpha/beta hydrolase fold domain-containing protein [Brucella intermedia]|uniref:alpha/beta hydrolase fold domain-containing protein n=1 Tax=Brucella intermedia TaxID=94625 RepID=UPI00224B7829|nr:alpha/beta hydrolase fold domain-containing protein [Brucella intermedia]
MAIIEHSLHPADRAEMEKMRAYLAQQPKLTISPETKGIYDAFMASILPAVGVTFEQEVIGDIPGWWCKPGSAEPEAAIIHFHGGAYVVGSAEAYRPFVSHIAAGTGMAVFIPDYALAPERPFPAAFHDAGAVLDGLHRQGFRKLALTGDSAGGGLALALAQDAARNKTQEGPSIQRVVAISPWTDLTLTAPSLASHADIDPVLTCEVLAGAAELYAGASIDRRDPRLSPLFGVMSGMPPVMIHIGTDEILFDDAVNYDTAAQRQGATIETHVWSGMTHVFPANIAMFHAAREAMNLSSAFLRSGLRSHP